MRIRLSMFDLVFNDCSKRVEFLVLSAVFFQCYAKPEAFV